MKQSLQISFVVTIFFALASVSTGGVFEDGLSAAESGDFKKAYQLWLVAAENGNVSAQGYLGTLYAKGLGVVQDDTEAAK